MAKTATFWQVWPNQPESLDPLHDYMPLLCGNGFIHFQEAGEGEMNVSFSFEWLTDNKFNQSK